MRATPGSTVELVADWGGTGATLGVRLLDNQGNTVAARETGFIEYPAGSGVYYKPEYTGPEEGGYYTLLYDDDNGTAAAGHVATEQLLVSISAPDDVIIPDAYATRDELARILKIRTPSDEQWTAMDRVLTAAAGEINSEIGLT